MTSLAQMAKAPIRWTLQRLGLHKFAHRRVLQIRMLLYRNIKIFSATLNDVMVHFSTEDEYSKSWFFPRYAGGLVHEKTVTEKIITELQSAQCFLDVGAHLGWYTCIAAKHMPHGCVYGFEMDDLTFSLLEKNVAINHCTNVEIYNMAVSDSLGKVSYKREHKRPSPGLRMQANTKEEDSAELVSVNSVVLDDFLTSKKISPDVIKIDVEGAEMNVLKGMKQTLLRHKPTLFLEIHPSNLPYFNTSTSDILSLLIENGYEVFEIESMRSQEAAGQLKPLQQNSKVAENTMLFAAAAR